MSRAPQFFLPLLALLLADCVAPPPSKAPPAFVGDPKSGNDVTENRYIVVDQFGYRPDMRKVAVLVDPQEGWNAADEYEPGETLELRRFDDGRVVLTGNPVPWLAGTTQATSGDRGAWFDFSAVTEPGSYFVFDRRNSARSVRFDIERNVYRDVLKAAVRMFYFNRANLAKEKPFACVGEKCWLATADYLGPGQDKEARSVAERGNPNTIRDLSGGWWDAGDTDKYTTFTHAVLHQLLTAYDEHPGPFTDDYDIPESGNGLPDLLDEIKVELDFLRKMQPADLNGGALLKVGNVEHGDPIPQDSKFERFYYPAPCSSASVTLAGVFAHASITFSKFAPLADYAADLKQRALSAWQYYSTHPESDACDDGTIKSGDADVPLDEQDARGVVAAVYLYALTDDKKFNEFIDKNKQLTRPFKEDLWSMYEAPEGDAFLFYSKLPNGNPELKRAILERKRSVWEKNEIFGMKPDRDLYRAFMPDWAYHWGSNQPRANVGNTNFDVVQYGLLDSAQIESARERAAGVLNSFHGVNAMQLVYLTQMGPYGAERSVSEMFHMWFRDGDPRWDSAKDSQFGPAPGYVTGGPNKSYCESEKDHKCHESPFRQQPPQKAYRDFNTAFAPQSDYDMSWAITEPAIYYQAAYVKLLSKFVD